MMKSSKCEILWSPIRGRNEEQKSTFVALTGAELAMYRCSKRPGPDANNPDNKDLPPCIALDWNPFETHMLATAFNRGKTYLWNVDLRQAARGNTEPQHWELQLDNGEFVTALAWRHCQQTPSVIVGTTKDRLKVIHVRGYKDQQLIVSTWSKAVYNITPHPSNSDLFLSATQDGSIHLYDIGTFGSQFAVLSAMSDHRQISKIAWSPTSDSNGLTAAALYRDAAHVRLFTVFHLFGQDAPDTEPFVADRYIHLLPCDASRRAVTSYQAISSFAWHGTTRNVILAIISRSQLVASSFTDPTTLHILPDNNVLCCANRNIHIIKFVPSDPSPLATMDLSELFQYRINHGYGTKVASPWGTMSPEAVQHSLNQCARPFWNWLSQRQKVLTDDGRPDLRGVCAVFASSCSRNSSSSSLAATAASISHRGRVSSSAQLQLQQQREEMVVKLESTDHTAKLYTSPERQDIVRLCGWPVITADDAFAITAHVRSIADAPGQAARAAATALYLLKLPLALEVLSQAASGSSQTDEMLPIVALALPGVLGESSNMPSTYEANLKKVTEPYLKLLLTFGRFVNSPDSVLYDDRLVLEDRVAIAAMYLPDDRFNRFISTVSRQHFKDGRLAGLLFTGLESPDFVRLLQNYLNATGDIQTIAMACAHAFGSGVGRKPPPEFDAWTEMYRQLLNRFRLFRHRAAFDDFRRQLGVTVVKPRPTVSLGCSYCEKAVVQSVPLAGMQRVLPIYCQSCKRPLPRCAVCLARVGDDGWITWCQTCRHGGHAHHLLQWFSQTIYCPVVGCHCTCMQLDPTF